MTHSFILDDLMLLPPPRARAATWLCALLALCAAAAGCAEPPTREIDQAQAAIEVAVSAGAERFAPADLTAARTALTQARDAVGQRDFKQALAHALDSRERAQTATRAAGDARAVLKRDAQAALAEVLALQARAQRLITIASSGPARARARRARPLQARLTASVQEARAWVEAGDDIKASEALPGLKTDLERLVAELEERPAAQSSRSPR
ncbi:MAG TPA: DUF4398 domain-containing protein [Vicinamibacterales bacterium]|nr:DUF4398 domain-containing protein [Vicinamibacterales bacterium]